MVKVVIIRMDEWMEFLETGQSPGPSGGGGGGGAVLIGRERTRKGGGISISQREPIN